MLLDHMLKIGTPETYLDLSGPKLAGASHFFA